MKKTNIIFWATTIPIFLFEGVLTALTSQTEMAKEGIRHLQYPEYFSGLLAAFKILGALTLIIPQVPARVKEWAYAGFGFNFIYAAYSHGSVDGFDNFQSYFPLLFLALLAVSYIFHHKRLKNSPTVN